MAAATSCPVLMEPPRIMVLSKNFRISPTNANALHTITRNGHVNITADSSATNIAVDIHIKAGGQDEADAAACLDAISITTPEKGRTQMLEAGWSTTQLANWGSQVSFDITAPPSDGDPDVPEFVIIDGMRIAGDGKTPSSTRLILDEILVTNVQLEELVPEPEDVGESNSARVRTPAPTGNLLITLALNPAQAERVVFTAEHGLVWLGAQYTELDLSNTRLQHRIVVNEPSQGEG